MTFKIVTNVYPDKIVELNPCKCGGDSMVWKYNVYKYKVKCMNRKCGKLLPKRSDKFMITENGAINKWNKHNPIKKRT